MIVRAAKPIESGRQVTITYDYDVLFTSLRVRNDSVKTFVGCVCHCERCSDKERQITDQSIFDTLLDNNPTIVYEALTVLSDNLTPFTDFAPLYKLAQVYTDHLPPTHALGYLMFRKATSVLLTSPEHMDKAIFFSSMLGNCVEAWKRSGTIAETVTIEIWHAFAGRILNYSE